MCTGLSSLIARAYMVQIARLTLRKQYKTTNIDDPSYTIRLVMLGMLKSTKFCPNFNQSKKFNTTIF